MSKLFIGTSGFSYSHWENNVFYPENLPRKDQLKYFTQHFKTVELNNSFYRLPSEEAFLNWRKITPPDFLFAIKANRFITHIKKLNQCQKNWEIFFKRSLILRPKLGPFLFQLPPNWKINLNRFKSFVEMIEENSSDFRFVFEFRNPSWFSKDIVRFLKNYENISLCLADSPNWPKSPEIESSFVYLRMHGGRILYGSEYSEKELKELVFRIENYQKRKLDVYCYFNNDAQGFAVRNAERLLQLCNGGRGFKKILK